MESKIVLDKRPMSLTIIAWLLILLSLYGLFIFFKVFLNPEAKDFLVQQSGMPLSMHYFIALGGAAATIASAIGILKRYNWARFLYLVYMVFSLLIGLIIAQSKLLLIPGLIIQLILVFFLFRKKANLYFTGKTTLF